MILPVLSFLTVLQFCFSQQDTCLHLNFETTSGGKGDEVCIRVVVKNFTGITSMQFPINFDPRVVMPVSVDSFVSFVGFDPQVVNFDNTQGSIRIAWNHPNADTINLNDNTLLFRVCFKLIGAPGECTKIIFSDRPIITEFRKRFYPSMDEDEICVVDDNPLDEICIGVPNDLCVLTNSCGSLTNNGTITIKAWGGRAPYTVTGNTIPPTNGIIPNPGDAITINNQVAGKYTFYVTDGRGTIDTVEVTVGTNAGISISRDISYILDPTCWYTANGRIGINVLGGSGKLFIKWLPLNIYGNSRINRLLPGTYTAVVSDSLGCTVTESFVLRADTLKADLVTTDASCNGLCNGKATVTATGGTPYLGQRYEFVWSQASKYDCPQDRMCSNDSLCGNQFVVIRDSRKCEDTIYFNLGNSTSLKNQISIDSIKCPGDLARINATLFSTGAINLPITFDLRDITNTSIPGGVTNNTSYVSNALNKGIYYLHTTDNIGCEKIDTIIIIEPAPLSIIENQIDTTESCTPGGDAFIDLRGIDGTAPYRYSWSNGRLSNRIDTLRAGTYTVTVTDYYNCSATKSFTITKPLAPVINGFTVTDLPCFGDLSGCVEVLYTQGSSPVNFTWNVPGNSSKICNLDTGSYTVILTDQFGCSDTSSARVNVSKNGIVIDSIILINPSCPGKGDGIIIAFAKGGSGQLSYTWSNNINSPVNSGLKAGRYILSVDDIGGCPPLLDTFDLVDRPKPSIQLSSISNISCAEVFSCDASAIVTINTSDSIMVATWSSGEQKRYISTTGTFTDTARLLCAGQQYVIISINDLCADTVFFNVDMPQRISLDTANLILNKPSCFGRNDGSIVVAAKGGCSPFTYDWVNPARTSQRIDSLVDGYYKVKITDCRGCVHFDSIRLRQPDTIRVQIIPGSSFDVSCPGKMDGVITLAWNGGSGGKGNFSWFPNSGQDSVLNNLGAGTYRVTVTDRNNCTGTASFVISEPTPINFNLSPIDTPKCSNGQSQFSVINASGGAGASYKWTINNSQPNSIGDFVPLFPGNYIITIFDKNGCTKDTFVSIPNPIGDIELEFGIDFDTIQLGDSIRLIGSINSQSRIDSIIWDPNLFVSNPNSTDSYVKPPETTVFMLTVVDENGCRASDKVEIVVESVRRFFAPNVISPNDDNANDFLEFVVGQDVESVELVEVYDRWGNRLYHIEKPIINNNIVRTWNGRTRNETVNPGVYVYFAKVKFKDGFSLVYRGDLTVLR
ncbi:MAG: gliding motility-associated C-terminal domain-containing protein [Saprospiraceae bacterium]|nr:gliding motility-associated C-terminal domain-containing protein [Saprospiraceae bacterium]